MDEGIAPATATDPEEGSGFDPAHTGVSVHLLVERANSRQSQVPGERKVKAVCERERSLLFPEGQGIDQCDGMIRPQPRKREDFGERICQ